MKTTTALHSIPQSSVISEDFGRIDFLDSFMVRTSLPGDVDKFTTEVFRTPRWVDFLMNLRNKIVGVLGFASAEDKVGEEAAYYPVGSKAVYFTVIARNENEIVISEEDKHLNFRASVLLERENGISKIYVTTLVHYNNGWGRVYFFFIKPFHKLIIRSLLKKLAD